MCGEGFWKCEGGRGEREIVEILVVDVDATLFFYFNSRGFGAGDDDDDMCGYLK